MRRADLAAQADAILSREEFSRFIEAILDGLREAPEDWRDVSLEGFLAALARAVDGSAPREEPTWSYLAERFLAALS